MLPDQVCGLCKYICHHLILMKPVVPCYDVDIGELLQGCNWKLSLWKVLRATSRFD